MCIGGGGDTTPVKVICAGSLVAPFEALEEAYEAANPHIDIQLEAHGSIQVIRQVSELGQEAEVLAVADYSLIPMLMYDTQSPCATWYVQFATNKLGIAYHAGSAYAGEMTQETWYDILSREDVVMGLSDPRFDASGYRTLMILQLAEEYYGDDGILESVLGNSFSTALMVTSSEDGILITVPEIFESISAHIALRGSSVQLLSLLDAGAIDYAFEYENVSRYYGLEYLQLPSPIDLSSEQLATGDVPVRVDLAFQRFSTVIPEFVAQKTYYAVTIPSSARHTDEAAAFVAFMLSEEGTAIMESTYLDTLDGMIADDMAAVPEIIVESVTWA
jgi:molybdate/tungstate transport system substrate-binding protein